ECPRNVFAPRSGQNELRQHASEPAKIGPGCDAAACGHQSARVREPSSNPATDPDYQRDKRRPAHPSNRLVAQLNTSWRVIDDPLQGLLQRRKGNPRSKNSGWENRSFCTTREALLRCVREFSGEVDHGASLELQALPKHHSGTGEKS